MEFHVFRLSENSKSLLGDFFPIPAGKNLANVGSFLRPIARKYKKDPARIYGFIVDRRSRKRKQESLVLSILAAPRIPALMINHAFY